MKKQIRKLSTINLRKISIRNVGKIPSKKEWTLTTRCKRPKIKKKKPS